MFSIVAILNHNKFLDLTQIYHLIILDIRSSEIKVSTGLFQERVCLLGFSSLSSVQSLSCVQLFATPWTAAHQASLSITNSWSLLKLVSVESLMPSNHLILCRPLLLPPSIFPSITVFSTESALCIRWPSFSFVFQMESMVTGTLNCLT